MKHYDTPVVCIEKLIEDDILTVSNGSDMSGLDTILGTNNPWGGM